MNYAVEMVNVEQQLVAAARQRTSLKRVSLEIRQLLNAPWDYIHEHPDIRRGGHNVAIYWSVSGEGDVEVGVQIVREFEPTDSVVLSATPAGRVATTAHYGPYSELGLAYQALQDWSVQHNQAFAGPFWEIYGDWEDDPAKLRTDILYLLA
jgi:effector-binding domain-containing protein